MLKRVIVIRRGNTDNEFHLAHSTGSNEEVAVSVHREYRRTSSVDQFVLWLISAQIVGNYDGYVFLIDIDHGRFDFNFEICFVNDEGYGISVNLVLFIHEKRVIVVRDAYYRCLIIACIDLGAIQC